MLFEDKQRRVTLSIAAPPMPIVRPLAYSALRCCIVQYSSLFRTNCPRKKEKERGDEEWITFRIWLLSLSLTLNVQEQTDDVDGQSTKNEYVGEFNFQAAQDEKLP